jgi:hypothetical protein
VGPVWCDGVDHLLDHGRRRHADGYCHHTYRYCHHTYRYCHHTDGHRHHTDGHRHHAGHADDNGFGHRASGRRLDHHAGKCRHSGSLGSFSPDSGGCSRHGCRRSFCS